MNTNIMRKINKLKHLSVSGGTTVNNFDDLNLFKHQVKEISFELAELLDEFKLYTIYQDDADWDEFHGFTVVAKSEKEAREIAQKTDNSYSDKSLWLDPKRSLCTPIDINESKVISSDFNQG